MVNYSTNLTTWGAAGSQPPSGYAYEQDKPPVDDFDNYVTDQLIKDVKNLISTTNRRIESDKGTTAPSSPEDGHLFFDRSTDRLRAYGSGSGWEQFVRRGGDAMTGNLDLNGNNLVDGTGPVNVTGDLDASSALYEAGNRAATRAWTNANADVPNADHADYSDTAGSLDELQAGGGVKSGVNNDRAYFAPYDGAGSPNYNREISYDPNAGEWDIEGSPRAGGQTIATENWVNANADVPNADFADTAGSLQGGWDTNNGPDFRYNGRRALVSDAGTLMLDYSGDHGSVTTGSNSQLYEDGSRVATRTWTEGGLNMNGGINLSNYNLSNVGKISLDREGIVSNGANWLEIDGGSSGLLLNYNNNKTIRLSGKADFRNGQKGLSIGDLDDISANGEGSGNGLDADTVDGSNVFVQSTQPSGASDGDIWIDTS
jgi:hypothetical protein